MIGQDWTQELDGHTNSLIDVHSKRAPDLTLAHLKSSDLMAKVDIAQANRLNQTYLVEV